MRIAQISTLSTPVRQIGSASVEGIVWVLTRELVRLGHDVTVFAAGGSETDGDLYTTLPGPYATNGSPGNWQLCEWINICRAVEQSDRFDVLHSHAYLFGIPLQKISRAPMIHTMHVCPNEEQAKLWSMVPDACVTATSKYQWSAFPEVRPNAVIYYGVDLTQFSLQPEPQDYVCYLGRFTPGKGVLHAITVGKALGIRLLIAGPRNAYFRHHVEHLVDGHSVEYVGPVSGSERNQLLGGARALLYSLEAPEPFGLVQVEAMLCGTPVAAIAIGAVPEIIENGVTGYCAVTAPDLPKQVLNCFTLDRKRVRERAQERFSADRMADEYVRVYEQVASGKRSKEYNVQNIRFPAPLN